MPTSQQQEPLAWARLVQHPKHGAVLAFKLKFDQQRVELFKSMVPSGSRQWDADDKLWYVWVDPLVLKGFLEPAGIPLAFPWPLIGMKYPDAQLGAVGKRPKGSSAAPAAPGPADDPNVFRRRYATEDDWRTLWLVEGAPQEVAKAAYRALALKLHPDRGGDPGALQRVNAAWARVEATFTGGAT